MSVRLRGSVRTGSIVAGFLVVPRGSVRTGSVRVGTLISGSMRVGSVRVGSIVAGFLVVPRGSVGVLPLCFGFVGDRGSGVASGSLVPNVTLFVRSVGIFLPFLVLSSDFRPGTGGRVLINVGIFRPVGTGSSCRFSSPTGIRKIKDKGSATVGASAGLRRGLVVVCAFSSSGSFVSRVSKPGSFTLGFRLRDSSVSPEPHRVWASQCRCAFFLLPRCLRRRQTCFAPV